MAGHLPPGNGRKVRKVNQCLQLPVDQLRKFAKRLWQNIQPELKNQAVILALEGPLGAGKTTLIKHLAKVMDIKETVASPTFNLHENYGTLEHIDAWRVEDWEEIEALGLRRMLEDRHLVAIEWADRFQPQILGLPAKIIWVKMGYGAAANERVVEYEDLSNMRP